MRKHILILLFFIPVFTLNAGEIVLQGIYKGENIYVENPYASSGVGYCVYEVSVNGFTTTDEINSSFFEIDLSVYGLKFGDQLKIIIKHKDDCKPKVLNSEVLVPLSTCIINSITIDKSRTLKWSTTKEHGSLPFVVEQYRWNKWIRIGSINGKGTNTLNHYSYKVEFHSGLNKFRIKQTGASKKARYSKTVQIKSNISENNFIPGNGNKADDQILFSFKTRFEIYDYYGKLVKSGTGHDIDIKKLKAGTYFLNYDNKTETFIKK